MTLAPACGGARVDTDTVELWSLLAAGLGQLRLPPLAVGQRQCGHVAVWDTGASGVFGHMVVIAPGPCVRRGLGQGSGDVDAQLAVWCMPTLALACGGASVDDGSMVLGPGSYTRQSWGCR